MEVAPDMKTASSVAWALLWRMILIGMVIFIFGWHLIGAKILLLNIPLTYFISAWVLHRMMNKGFGRYRLSVKLREN